MKALNNIFVYALLFTIPTLTTSCFLFQKHTTKSSSSTDSTAYSKIESSTVKHQEEAWKNYLNNTDSSNSGVSFYDNPNNWLVVYPDGKIEASGSIKDVTYTANKQTTKKDSGRRIVAESTKYINTTYTIKETVTKSVIKEVERKRDILWYILFVIGVIGLLVCAYLERNWFVKLWIKVINFLKGFFTGV